MGEDQDQQQALHKSEHDERRDEVGDATIEQDDTLSADDLAEEQENGDTISPLTAQYLFPRGQLPSDPRTLPSASRSSGSTSSESTDGHDIKHEDETYEDGDDGDDGDGAFQDAFKRNSRFGSEDGESYDDDEDSEISKTPKGADQVHLGKVRRDTQSSFASIMSAETDEDDNGGFDPRRVGMENAVFGDYDMKKSPSTQDFVLSYIDDEMARRNFPGRLSVIANESLTARRRRRGRTPAGTVPEGDENADQDEDMEEERHESFGSDRADGKETPYSTPVKPSKDQSKYRSDTTPEEPAESASPAPLAQKLESKLAAEFFGATADMYMEGITSIVDDNFWKCFESKKPRPWNWNAYLWPMWAIGVLVRYFILFPIRMVIFIVGWIVFGSGMFFVQNVFKKGPRRTNMEHKLIMMMCGVFCITWGAVIRYHGSYVKPKPGECHPVYVANHTSMIDVIILQQMRCFSLVGQRHKGIVRFLQEVVLACLQCVWFDRGEIKDRAVVAQKLKEHALDPNRNPLLVFPEGTCVNNEYVIQFKKGIFELGVPVVPVAIRYNKLFVDPFWNSRQQSFPMHLVELMTSFCLICDVWYLKPQVRRPGESATQFAARVKKSIADKAGLKNVNWDGYMKYWKPSARYLHARQEMYADKLRSLHLPERQNTPDEADEDLDDVDSNGQGTRLRKTHSM